MTARPIRPQVAVHCNCILGEGPVWDHRTGMLHWVDINGEGLWSWTPGGESRQRLVGEHVGFVLLTPNPDRMILGLKSGLATYDLSTGATSRLLAPEPDLPGNRPNDAVVAPDGSVFFGTLNEADHQPTGQFYHWSAAGLVRFGDGTRTTNGPAIDPDRRLLYATDTSRGRVCRYAMGEGGSLGPRQDFVSFGAREGHPDGMAIDAEGHVWICHFRGARITRFSPDGEAVLTVPMPVSQVTKIAFGGPDLQTIYVTSAARDLDKTKEPLAGHLFRIDAGIRGIPAAISTLAGL